MAETIEKTRARQALQQLGKYYGLHKKSIADGASSGKDLEPPPEATIFSTNPVTKAFLSKGKTVPLLSAVIKAGAEIEKSTLLITPFDSASVFNDKGHPAHNKNYLDPAYQGFGKGPYFVQDYLPKKVIQEITENSSKANPPKIHVIQSFDPKLSPATRDADIASMLLNAIPTIEWSRCVPYFEMVVLSETAASTEQEPGKNTLLKTFLTPIAEADAGDDAGKAGKSDSFYNALYNFESEDAGSGERKPVKATSDGVAAVMDIFCLPQTMTQNEDYHSKIAKGYNPFAPLMSVDSFSTTLSGYINDGKKTRPGESQAKSRTASLRVRIHDKRRLNEVAALVKPGSKGGYGGTRLGITYGWGHPAELEPGRPSDANFSARFGDFLAACRTTEVYTITTTRMSFVDGGEVQLDMELSVSETQNTYTSQKLAGSESLTGTEFQESVESIIDFVAMNDAAGKKANGRTPNFHIKAFKKELKSEKGYPPEVKEKLANYFEAIKNVKSRKGITGTAGIEELGTIFTDIFGEGNGSVFAEAAVKSNPASTTDALFSEVCKGIDPFLRPKYANNPIKSSSLASSNFKKYKSKTPGNNAFVSFGKLVTFFLSKALLNADVHETQVVFFPFNRSAAGVFDYNIAQFPIPASDFKKKAKAYVKKNGNVQMNDFLTFVIDTYIHDSTMSNSMAYGLKGVKKANKRKTRLNQMYGRTGSKTAPVIEPPNVVVEMSTHIAREELTEKSSQDLTGTGGDNSPKKIFRVEIYDTKTTAGPFLTDLEKSGDTGAIQAMKRDTSKEREAMGEGPSKYAPDHQGLYDAQRDYFAKAPREYVKIPDVSDDKVAEHTKAINDGIDKDNEKIKNKKKKKKHVKPEDVKTMLSEFIFIDNSKTSAKQLKKEEIQLVSNGYMIVGCEGSSISDINVQTQENGQLTSIEMQDRRTAEERAEHEKQKINSLPISSLPTEIDITCLGNPYIHNAQEYYIDLGTGTSIDGYYNVINLEHTIEPGKFETKFKLSPQGGGTIYQDPAARLQSFVAGQLGRK